MIIFRDKLTGADGYSLSTKDCGCDVIGCDAPAVYQLRTGGYTAEMQYYCEDHLETKEFVLPGQCDLCLKRKTFENWLSLTRVKSGSRNLLSICQKCYPI